MTPLVLATTNRGKVRELEALLDGLPVALSCLADHPAIGPIEEDGATFAENARLKARAVAAATGLPALADDSGLAVDVLGGEPGVRSARYAGEGATDAANRARLRERLAGRGDGPWAARFVAALALVTPTGEVWESQGVCEGHVQLEERGDRGFGYDPLFVPLGGARTLAELDGDLKNALSHRGQAARALLPTLRRLLG